MIGQTWTELARTILFSGTARLEIIFSLHSLINYWKPLKIYYFSAWKKVELIFQD